MKRMIMAGLGLFFISQSLSAQNDYVLTKSNDTIKATIISWNNTAFAPYVTCEVKGQKQKFKAKKLIEFKAGDTYYEVGRICPVMIGFKKNMFLTRLMSGKINLYDITVTDHFTTTRTTGSTTIKNYSAITATIAYIRKTSDPKRSYKKMMGYKKLKAMATACDTYQKKYQEVDSNEYPYGEQINYYNENCKN